MIINVPRHEEVDYPQYDFEGSTRSSWEVDQAGIDGIVEMIKAVGPERTVLATDLGQVHNPPPWEGLRMFLEVLLEKGIPKGHLKRMVQDNPAYLLNIQ